MVLQAGKRDQCTWDVARLSERSKNTLACGSSIFTLSESLNAKNIVCCPAQSLLLKCLYVVALCQLITAIADQCQAKNI